MDRFNDTFTLTDSFQKVYEDVASSVENLGFKKANVYFYTKKPEGITWTQIIPTPDIVDFSHNIKLLEAGSVTAGDLFIKNISRYSYSFSDLETATVQKVKNDKDAIEKYWIIREKSGVSRAYTTVNIVTEELTYDVHVTRYQGVNEDDLDPGEQLITENNQGLCIGDQLLRI